MFDSVRNLCIIADKAKVRKCETVVRASVRKMFIRARAGVRKLLIIADKRELGIYRKGCRCGERLRAKGRGGENLAHTRWSGGRGYRGRGKWIRGESFGARGVSVCERERVYTCARKILVSVSSLSPSRSISLSLSRSSLSDIRIIQGLFLKVSAEYL